MRILTIDDDDAIRTFLHALLSAEGWEVHGVGSGQEALDSWRDLRPDVIVLDYMMPGMNGIETAQRLLDDGFVGPWFLFSGYLDPAVAATAEYLGLWTVSKVNFSALVRTLQVLERDGYKTSPLVRRAV